MKTKIAAVAVLFGILIAQGAYATPLPAIPIYACINVVDADMGEYLSQYQYTKAENFAPPYEFMNYTNTITIDAAGSLNISTYAAPSSYDTDITIRVSKDGYTNSDAVTFNNSYYWSAFSSGQMCVVSHTFYLKKIVIDSGSGGSSGGGGGGGAATGPTPAQNVTLPKKTQNVTLPQNTTNNNPPENKTAPGMPKNQPKGPTGFFIGEIGAFLQSLVEGILAFFRNFV